jgi:HK97 family phage prohead protease
VNQKSFRGHAAVKDIDEGLAEVVVSVYGNVDHDGDIVVKGACAKQIAGDYGPNPKGLLDHDWSMRSAVAKTLRWWEEDDGLHIEAQYNLKKEAGRDAFSDLTFYGADMEFSVGYAVKTSERPGEADRAKGARRVITEWQINEWSHVMLGANSDTRLVEAKQLEQSKERTEAMEAKALVGSYEYLKEHLREALRDAFPARWLWIRGTLPDRVVFEREVETYDGYECSTWEVSYTEADGSFTFGEPIRVEISEIVEVKAVDRTAVPVPTGAVNRFRSLVATTRT